jgi:hypothetical protein
MFFDKCGELVRAEKQLEAFRKEKAESQSSSSSDAQPKPNTTTYVVGRDAVSITGATLNYTSAKRFHDYLDREFLNNRAVDRLALMDFSARKMLEGKFLLAGKIDEDNRDAWLGWTHEVFRTELLRAFPRPNTKAASQMTLDDELGRLRVEVNLRDQSPMDKYIGQGISTTTPTIRQTRRFPRSRCCSVGWRSRVRMAFLRLQPTLGFTCW